MRLPRSIRMPRVRVSVVVSAAFVCVVAACSGQGAGPSTPTRSVSGSGTSSTATETPVVTSPPGPSASAQAGAVREAAEFATAYPGVPQVTFPSKVATDRWLGPDAITADGRILGSTIDGQHIAREVVLFDPVTKHLQVLDRLPGDAPTGQQVVAGAVDGQTLLWLQGDGDSFDWQLKAYNLATGRLQILARHADFGGGPCQGPVSGLQVWGGRVYWSACAPKGNDVTLTSYSVDTSGGQPRAEVADSAEPYPTHAGMILRVPSPRDPATGAIALAASASRPTIVVDGPMMNFAADDQLLVWFPPELTSVNVISLASGAATTPAATVSIPANIPVAAVVTGPLAAWRTNDGPRLYDSRTKTLTHLAAVMNQPLLQNRHLLWGDVPPNNPDALFTTTFHLVDLTHLGLT